jgi:hypothetical protein
MNLFPYVGIPTHAGMLESRQRLALLHFARDFPGNCVRVQSMSLLAMNFNCLLADALNMTAQGVTHFILLHDDIVPQGEHWARDLMQELMAQKLDALAVHMPLRNRSGLTSTAIDDQPVPKQLRIEDLTGQTLTSLAEPRLLINSGLLIIDLRRPWTREFHFQIHDDIVQNEQGIFEARCISEDWMMSRWLAKRKIPFGATGKIRALHCGRSEFPNWVE